MYVLLFLVILIIAYISAFKDNFTQENIEKVTPVLFLAGLFIVVLNILGALV